MVILFIFLLIVVVVILTRVYMRYTIKMYTSNASMKGKVVIVTGANSGIGYYTAMLLARRSARVILACRDHRRGTVARDNIVSETGNTNVVFKQLDLSSLASVRKFAENIVESENQLHVLVNNAGVCGSGDRYTADGIVEGMQVNFFGPFLLTLLLLPLLKTSQPSRIVNLSSIAHFLGSVKLEHMNEKGYYSRYSTYFNSKLCNLIFSLELSRRLKDTGVVANAVHPGIIMTNISSPLTSLPHRLIFAALCWLYSRTVEEGAQTVIYLSVAEECATVSGGYFVDCTKRYVSPQATCRITAQRLWEYSEKFVGY